MRTYNCLIDIGSEDKKAQDAKKSIIKRKLKFKDYENHLKATQFENKINLPPPPPPTKKKVGTESLWENDNEFIKNNKLILKTREDNVFTEEVNKIALNVNDDKRIQSIDSVETYVYGTCKNWICKKEKTKCNNIIKQCKKWLTLMMLQKKTKIIIQVGNKFLITHVEY